MIFWILVALAIIIAVWVGLVSWSPGLDVGMTLFISAIVIGLWGGIGTSIAYSQEATDTKPLQTQRLVSVGNQTQTEGHMGGSIFGYYGVIDGKRVVYYTVQQEDGTYRLEQSNAEDTIIKPLDKGEKPSVDTLTYYGKQWLYVPWAREIGPENFENEGRTVTLHVPEGSISQDFTLDNQN